jgi:hypothetical protein
MFLALPVNVVSNVRRSLPSVTCDPGDLWSEAGPTRKMLPILQRILTLIAEDFNLGGRGHKSLVKKSGVSIRGR